MLFQNPLQKWKKSMIESQKNSILYHFYNVINVFHHMHFLKYLICILPGLLSNLICIYQFQKNVSSIPALLRIYLFILLHISMFGLQHFNTNVFIFLFPSVIKFLPHSQLLIQFPAIKLFSSPSHSLTLYSLPEHFGLHST